MGFLWITAKAYEPHLRIDYSWGGERSRTGMTNVVSPIVLNICEINLTSTNFSLQ